MMQGVYDKNDTRIIDRILDAVPDKVPIKVKNQLLDGSWHIQTIGEPADRVTVSIITDYTGMELMNEKESTGELIKVVITTPPRVWAGVIDAPPSWSRNGFIYQGNFVLLVTGSG